MTLEIRLLGGFTITAGKKSLKLPTRAAQSLFAYLMLNAGTNFRREKLAGMLWPDSTEESARDYLRHALWRIRKSLQEAAAASCLRADDLTIGIDASADYRLDAATLRKAPEAKAAGALMEALSAYGGELLPGFYDEWVVLEREHLQAVFERDMERLLSLLQGVGRWDEVLTWAEKWIALGQRPEPAYRALMLAHAAHGDMSKVAASYERCVKTLRDFGVEPSEQTRTLYEDIKSGKVATAAPVSRAAPVPEAVPASNIPVPLTSFIGRERELKKIAEMLASSRLLTLTGPGGVGKTRLALEAARTAAKKFKDGVFWVSLAALTDENLLSQEIAQTLHLREAADGPLLATLTRHLQAKETLLVLDNCEHLIHACAQIAEHLLGACPGVCILATSIEGLGLFNETVWQVPSLPLPAKESGVVPKELEKFESIRLFVDRASNANPVFALDERNATDVVQICKRLDGIPLAIELAAARIKVLSVQEIAARLDDRFSLLTAGSRTAIPRHQTLRATIDWSHDLLSEPERMLFRRLAVFAGGFTLEAAEAVCGEGGSAGGVLDSLGRLADKSLVAVYAVAPDEETRYRQLETIRQYALEKLVAAEEASRIRSGHLDFFVRLAEASESRLFVSESSGWSRRLDGELDNIRAAIEWAIASGKADHALRILGSLVYFWFARGLLISEWNDTVELALRTPEGKERTLARAKALNGMGLWYWADMASVDRRPELEEALAIGREFNDPWNIATALSCLGLYENAKSNFPQAQTLLDESLAIWLGLEAGGKLGTTMTLTYLGDLAMNQGDDARALQRYEETLDVLRDAADVNWQAYVTRRVGHVAWRAGDHRRAFELVRESLRMNQVAGDPRGICACLAAFAALAAVRGDYEAAGTLAGAVEAQLQAFGIRLLLIDRDEFGRRLAEVRSQVDAGKLEKLMAKGRGMSLDRAVAYALASGD